MRLARASRCVICGARRPRGHHVIRQQLMRRQSQSLGLDFEEVRWDTRGLLALCDRCHTRHHSRMAPVPLSVVLYHAPRVVALAKELDLTWWLSREYPCRRREP